MLIGWRAVPRKRVSLPAWGEYRKRGALVLGCIAATVMGLLNVVGCTSVTNGTATPDTNVAPAYRSSVSASVSASVATSSVRESQRQQSVTTSVVRTSCNSLADTSKDAIDKVNAFVAAFNAGKSTGPTEGPAEDALNGSATAVSGGMNDALSQQMRDAFNAYIDASRAVANAIATHASTGEFNKRVDALNDARTKALKMCVGYF
ncbi:MAG: hypothetical protein JO236_06315 [Mycobacterium sp.]|uniref:hypothetical protein n=1 Tax=Mycobacterium sp. TaxID=1785 RepID=UPI001ECB1ED6|nr:hypothetical protein [Mycobacterium sp.]MBW0017141.1 hypothetical protein [Mycobacterium sp.]